MKNMRVLMSGSTVRMIAQEADAAIEAARLSFVTNRPLTGDEWRKIMEVVTYAKVACANALREEEEND
jgi:hypothetical protein